MASLAAYCAAFSLVLFGDDGNRHDPHFNCRIHGIGEADPIAILPVAAVRSERAVVNEPAGAHVVTRNGERAGDRSAHH